jgi:LPXTG-site transpeptidase (sortase) family protein
MRKNMKSKKKLPYLLILLGAALIILAVAAEAFQFPWETVFGASQSLSSMPDPAPIVLQGEDSNSTLADGEEVTQENEQTDESAAPTELPGNKAAGEPQSVYVKLGIMKIPKLNVSQYILEGTARQLRYGVGHVVGTKGIGESGNCAIAGHNTSPFHYLYMLEAGDYVAIEANGNTYTYTVYNSFKVLPDEIWVLSDVPDETYTLTLITCTPYIVSSHRLIVRARLTDINGQAPDDFYKNSNFA